MIFGPSSITGKLYAFW